MSTLDDVDFCQLCSSLFVGLPVIFITDYSGTLILK